jgi:hypothetical protein
LDATDPVHQGNDICNVKVAIGGVSETLLLPIAFLTGQEKSALGLIPVSNGLCFPFYKSVE